MLIKKHYKKSIKEEVLKHLECSECRQLILDSKSKSIYTIVFAENKRYSNTLILCKECYSNLKSNIVSVE